MCVKADMLYFQGWPKLLALGYVKCFPTPLRPEGARGRDSLNLGSNIFRPAQHIKSAHTWKWRQLRLTTLLPDNSADPILVLAILRRTPPHTSHRDPPRDPSSFTPSYVYPYSCTTLIRSFKTPPLHFALWKYSRGISLFDLSRGRKTVRYFVCCWGAEPRAWVNIVVDSFKISLSLSYWLFFSNPARNTEPIAYSDSVGTQ